jgi:dihydroorotase
MQTTMSKMLNIGMPLAEVIQRSTVEPAAEINRPDLGHLSIGAEADVAVFRVLQGDFSFVDCGYAKLEGDRKLECAMTVRAGKIVFDPSGLSMPMWEDAPDAYWHIRY